MFCACLLFCLCLHLSCNTVTSWRYCKVPPGQLYFALVSAWASDDLLFHLLFLILQLVNGAPKNRLLIMYGLFSAVVFHAELVVNSAWKNWDLNLGCKIREATNGIVSVTFPSRFRSKLNPSGTLIHVVYKVVNSLLRKVCLVFPFSLGSQCLCCLLEVWAGSV